MNFKLTAAVLALVSAPAFAQEVPTGDAAAGEKVSVAAEPHGSAAEYYMVRDIDAVPAVFPAEELLEQAGQAVPRRR